MNNSNLSNQSTLDERRRQEILDKLNKEREQRRKFV
jgi:hypothetical protein